MSQPSSSAAWIESDLKTDHGVDQHPAARLVPDWHGRYQARRRRRRSDPMLARYLAAMAVVSVLGVALLLAFLLLKDLRESDRLYSESASLEATVAIDDILDEVAATIEDVAPSLSMYDAQTELETAIARRQARRDVFSTLDGSPVAGLVLVNALGEVLLEVGDPHRVNVNNWTKLPLEPAATILDRQIVFLSPDTGQGLQSLLILPDRERAVIAFIDDGLMTEALTRPFEAISRVYLYDGSGRILAASRGSEVVDAVVPQAQEARTLTQARYGAMTFRSGNTTKEQGQAVSRPAGEPNLYVTAIPRPITVTRFFVEKGHLLLVGIAMSLLMISLLIYVIQTEWKKHDRRANYGEDLVARSEIAADIMGAGIIDWRVENGVVSYSEGWQRLFAEGASTEDEEIFDWVEKLHPDCQAQARENYEALLEGRIFEIEHELKVRRRDGEYVTVRERGRARLDAAGTAIRIVLVQRLSRGETVRSERSTAS